MGCITHGTACGQRHRPVDRNSRAPDGPIAATAQPLPGAGARPHARSAGTARGPARGDDADGAHGRHDLRLPGVRGRRGRQHGHGRDDDGAAGASSWPQATETLAARASVMARRMRTLRVPRPRPSSWPPRWGSGSGPRRDFRPAHRLRGARRGR